MVWTCLLGRYSCTQDLSITAFARAGDFLFAAVGSDGKVLRSIAGAAWNDFSTIPSERVCSLITWRDQLYAGTGPDGGIWVIDQGTGDATIVFSTKDDAVTSMFVQDDNLYVGTAPRGDIWKYDGQRWRKLIQAGRGGVAALVGVGGMLYGILPYSESIIVFDGQNWSILPISNRTIPSGPVLSTGESSTQSQTLASFMRETKLPLSSSDQFVDVSVLGDASQLDRLTRIAAAPPNPTRAVSGATDGNSLLFGTASGSLYAYSNGLISESAAPAKGACAAITTLVDCTIFSSGTSLYMLPSAGLPVPLFTNTTDISALFGDAATGSLLVGCRDGRILLIDQALCNAWMSGSRSLYGQTVDELGYLSGLAWVNILYRLHEEVLQIDANQMEIVSQTAVLPSAATSQDSVDGVFVSPVLWGGNDFGFWQAVSWNGFVPGDTEVKIFYRIGKTPTEVLATEWINQPDGIEDVTRKINQPYIQLRAVMRSPVGGSSPTITELTATFQKKYAVMFCTKKFVLDRSSALSEGIITATITSPPNTEVVFGVTGVNSGDWGDYTPVPLNKFFNVPAGAANRIKIGARMIQYQAAVTPEIGGFALFVGGLAVNRINDL